MRDTVTKRTAGYEHIVTRDRHTFEIGEYETGKHTVTLINNHRARNTTYNNVMKFLERDKTDLMVYVPGNFMCAASPVVAEFDQDYIKNMRLLEIKTMRET